jgi:hypothetical protein
MNKKTSSTIVLIIVAFLLSAISPSHADVIFFDDFENILEGDYPDENGWYNVTSGVTAYVSTDQACSGTRSFRLEGQPYWARCDVISVTPADTFYYEVCVYLTPAARPAKVGFFQRFGSMVPSFNAVFFKQDGSLWFTGDPDTQLSGLWSPNTWYEVRVKLDFNSLKGNVYINDELRGENLDIFPTEFEYPSYGHVILNKFGACAGGHAEVGNTVMYIDYVKIYPPEIPTLTEWGLIIFGVVLIGFITWVFLKRRKAIGVRA